MSKNRLIFYSILVVFHLFLVVITFYIESQKDDFNFLFELLKLIAFMKYGAILGLIIACIDVIWSWKINRTALKEKAELTLELNTLKAKLFDLQESSTRQPAPKTPTNL
jgi:hypothetical protein